MNPPESYYVVPAPSLRKQRPVRPSLADRVDSWPAWVQGLVLSGLGYVVWVLACAA